MGFPTPDSLLSTATSESPVTSTASSSWSPQLGDSFTETVVRATKNSIPAITSSIQSNKASLRISSQVPGDSASAAPRLSFLQRPLFVRVQVKVFLQWRQVHLPFLRLLLSLRQCWPLPS